MDSNKIRRFYKSDSQIEPCNLCLILVPAPVLTPLRSIILFALKIFVSRGTCFMRLTCICSRYPWPIFEKSTKILINSNFLLFWIVLLIISSIHNSVPHQFWYQSMILDHVSCIQNLHPDFLFYFSALTPCSSDVLPIVTKMILLRHNFFENFD